MQQITEGLKEQFAKNIQLVIQQEGSKLRKLVTNGTQDTDIISFESMDTHEAEMRNKVPEAQGSMFGHYAEDNAPDELTKVEFRTPSISRRYLTASAYHWNSTLDSSDKVNLLSDPTSHFPKMAGWAIGRQQDRVIIEAFASPVRAGRSGNKVINFDVAGNVVPIGLNVADVAHTLNAQVADASNAEIMQQKRAGLTLEKLIKAHHILKKRSYGMHDKLYLLCSSSQIAELLSDPQITSHDYNTVRALVTGEVNSFMGFNFIVSEMLGGIYDTSGNGGHFAVRDCYAFNESAVRFNTVNGSVKRVIKELEEYHLATFMYYREHFGASRDNEKAIICIKCLEQYDAASHTGSLWKRARGENHKRGLHASIVPQQMFGEEVRDAANQNVINADGLKELTNSHVATVKKPMVVVQQNEIVQQQNI